MITAILAAAAAITGAPVHAVNTAPAQGQHQPASAVPTGGSGKPASPSTYFVPPQVRGFAPANQGMRPFDFARTAQCARLRRLNRTRRWRMAAR